MIESKQQTYIVSNALRHNSKVNLKIPLVPPTPPMVYHCDQDPRLLLPLNRRDSIRMVIIKKLTLSFQVGWREGLNNARAFAESRPEYPVRVLKHPIFQAYNDKLGSFEPCLDQTYNVLRVTKVQRRIDLVEDVHRRRLELEQGHDEREGDEGAKKNFFSYQGPVQALYQLDAIFPGLIAEHTFDLHSILSDSASRPSLG